jgi:CheY-like chemotaxis protein
MGIAGLPSQDLVGKADDGAPLSPLRILVIDDDPAVLDSMRFILELDSHAVTTADGGRAGIDAFAGAQSGDAPFGLVITDLSMPEVDGDAVAAEIKRLAPGTPVPRSSVLRIRANCPWMSTSCSGNRFRIRTCAQPF